ncbi:MAG: BatA domain-containing protein [Chthoniobacteraceae bacterium]
MNWLFPGFLAAGLAIGLPVLLHFLRSKPKTVVHFPSLRLLGETAIHDTRKHRLRRLITLLLRCLVIALLAAAFARPFWINQGTAHRHVLLVAVDNSMSMQATGRWDTLRELALHQLEGLGSGDQAALLLMQPHPAWLVPMTDDLGRVRAALQAATPGYEGTHYGPALQMASESLAATPGGEKTLFWMADEQQTGWQGTDFNQHLPAGVQVVFPAPASDVRRQAAITALTWPADGKHNQLLATIRQFQPLRDQRQLTVTSNGQKLGQQTVALEVGDNHVTIALPAELNARGVRVALDADDLPGDDVAWISSEKPAAGQVLLDASATTDFLTHALKATSRLATGGFEPSPLPGTDWPRGAVAILRDAATFNPPAVEALNRFFQDNGAVWVFVDGSAGQTAWLQAHGVQIAERATPDDPEHLRDWDPDHPALAAFSGQSLLPLLDIEFTHGFNLQGGALTPLASWPDGETAIAEWSDKGRRMLIAGFPPTREATNWPALPTFVPFVHQAVRWLGSFNAVRSEWKIGDTIPLHGKGAWKAIDALEPQKDLSVADSVRPAVPGLYEFVSDGKSTIYAVNPPAGESDLTPMQNPDQLDRLQSPASHPQAQPAPIVSLSDETSENQQRLWWWVLAICGLAILAELALANRTAM